MNKLAQGEQFNNWTVLSDAGKDGKFNQVYNCQCICGTIRIVRGSNLGKVIGCGCVRKGYVRQVIKKNTKQRVVAPIKTKSEKMILKEEITYKHPITKQPTNIMIDRKLEGLRLNKALENEFSLASYL